MAFDKTQPTDTTKIRNLGTVIRPNWVAIEEADSSFRPYATNLQNRTPLGVSNDPTNIADTSILYVKDDGAGNPELFVIDESANIVQMTEGGNLGSQNTDVYANSISFDAGTFTNNQNAMVTAWSFVTVSGSSISSQVNYGMTWTRTSSGVYKATFSASQVTNANYAVIGTAYSSSSGTEGANVTFAADKTKSTSEFSIYIRKIVSGSSNNDNADRSFMVAVFGGR